MVRPSKILCLVLMVLTLTAVDAQTPVLPDLSLPAPRIEGGKPLMQTLKNRQSSRAFSPEKLSPQILSDLLWAAVGINRADSGKRTAPSARNWQEVDVLVFLEEGIYRYDAKANILKGLMKGDLRRLAGTQDFVASAPLNLIFVAEETRIEAEVTPEDKILYAGAESGFISQNVYLFCASEGLATVVRASVDRKALAEALRFPPTSRITLGQTVGYPTK